MKFVLCFVCFLVTAVAVNGQASNSYTPNFAAVVVANMNTSSSWYQSVFGLTVKGESNDPSKGYKVTVLTSGAYDIELIELSGSLTRSSVLAGQPSGTQIQGLFKFGFSVSDMDALLSHLAEAKVTVPRIWTDQATQKRNFIITDPDGNFIHFFE
jgi:predicted enzyme related to lactoylglutathione lyase